MVKGSYSGLFPSSPHSWNVVYEGLRVVLYSEVSVIQGLSFIQGVSVIQGLSSSTLA